MKVLVTGGAGFIGSHIVDQLVERGAKVIIVDDLSTGKEEHINPSARYYRVNIRDRELEQVFKLERPEYVIHQAAHIDVQNSLLDPIHDASINIMGTINLLEYCRRYAIRKIIYASSAAVYGDPEYLGVDEGHPIHPMSFYGISKYTCEHYIRSFASLYSFNYTILRYANAYGIRQDPKGEGGVVSIFLDKLLRGEQPYIYGDGGQTRDFIYVEDIAAANLAAIDKGDGQLFNISTNQPTSVFHLWNLMSSIFGANMLPIYKSERKGDIRDSYLNNERALVQLGWEPQHSLLQGLEKTLRYYRTQMPIVIQEVKKVI